MDYTPLSDWDKNQPYDWENAPDVEVRPFDQAALDFFDFCERYLIAAHSQFVSLYKDWPDTASMLAMICGRGRASCLHAVIDPALASETGPLVDEARRLIRRHLGALPNEHEWRAEFNLRLAKLDW